VAQAQALGARLKLPHVLIAGAGIGGLCTALALHARGIPAQLFESAAELRPLGVGINLLPHAMAELAALELADEIAALGVRTAELCYFNRRGQLIWREPRGLDAGYPVPQVSVNRGLLQQALHQAVVKRLGGDAIRAGHALVSCEPRGAGVRVRFAVRGTGAVCEEDADLLIGADGIHSQVRAALHPGEGPPCWNGSLLWRGVTVAEPFLGGRTMIMAGHADHKFVCYPIARAERGRHLLNWVAELRFPVTELAEREDWNREGKLEDFLPRFEAFRFDWLDAPALIRGAEVVYVYPMVDRDPLPRWSQGRVTLLGDAAHPMYPIGSNGASQAILDARTLAGCLRCYRDPVQALGAYEQARRPPTAAIVLSNRKQGPEECMTIVEQRSPDGFERIEDVISHAELSAIADKYKQLAGFSIAELNQRPSLAHAEY
jgi:2-polyprenyl-6-methoxyphenol hydroxylase-like FAD-dependent oxidoreductase